ncbi:uncharacterized protein CDV56_102270 [Aspergillus thermomutatus]|uniref:Uncharacterized protein n=1 Tax=Aspergillus thermomutatus TaxID=41047 RepID=A0A397H4J3_ASPTH|nr:uncharacterized protein CDV56_102270 [Aspergillus thermomutatus]RHZ56574.1 hypothetical protein CDV56_102270 [Aspergillus thermomutatus]
MAPRKVMSDTPTQRTLSGNTQKRERPETDYERWQHEQDQSYLPGERPQYAPSSAEPHNDKSSSEHQTEDDVLGGSDELRHGQHYVKDRPTSHGYFVSSKASADALASEDSVIATARKVLQLGNETSMGSLLLFAVLLMILFRASKSIKRGRRCRTFPRSGDTWDGSQFGGKLSL